LADTEVEAQDVEGGLRPLPRYLDEGGRKEQKGLTSSESTPGMATYCLSGSFKISHNFS
jgi:hypothetical protein